MPLYEQRNIHKKRKKKAKRSPLKGSRISKAPQVESVIDTDLVGISPHKKRRGARRGV